MYKRYRFGGDFQLLEIGNRFQHLLIMILFVLSLLFSLSKDVSEEIVVDDDGGDGDLHHEIIEQLLLFIICV